MSRSPQPVARSRRHFLERCASAGAAAVLFQGCRSTQLPGMGGALDGPSARFELEEITLDRLQEAMQSGRLTCSTVTELYLERISQMDRRGPTLRAVIEVNPAALDEAERLDRERAQGRLRGPLHGVPILLKDNVATADRMTTTAGSLALEGSIPPRDSWVAARLRESGALLLGKTNMSEWANFRSPHSTSGWSARGGLCRNPYDLSRSPCGSSSGSAAAVSANFSALAIGTETDGSIVCPSSVCGVVGIKPTVGLVGRSGLIPISQTQDSAGPMARTVRDAAILLGALSGVDPLDAVTRTSQGRSHSDYTKFLGPDLRGVRVGVLRQFFGFHDDVDAILERSLDLMGRAGAILVERVSLPSQSELNEAELEILLYEFKAGLDSYLADLGPSAPVKSLKEVIEFNLRHAAEEMPYFGQEFLVLAQSKGPLTEPEYLSALETSRRLSRDEGIDKVMEAHDLDALFAPSGGPAWKTDLLLGDPSEAGGSTRPAARAGYPTITVPAGNVRGMPVGISFLGRAWTEPRLLRIAHAFEQISRARTIPSFRFEMS